jgi:mono/diheme cytochrome c family protein
MTGQLKGIALIAAVALVAAAFVVPGPERQGQSRFPICAGCHQANGRGMPGTFPPLAGSEIAASAPEIPIRIVLHGLQGPLTVNGQRFNGTMPAWGQFSDADIAATLTYVRSQWGNSESAVTPAQVTAVRQATAGRSRAWTGAEIEALLRGQ